MGFHHLQNPLLIRLKFLKGAAVLDIHLLLNGVDFVWWEEEGGYIEEIQ